MSSPGAQMRRIAEKEQSIHFYRVDTGANESGRPHDFNPLPMLNELTSLPFTSTGGRYMPLTGGDFWSGWVDRGLGYPAMRFALIRRNALPQSESAGELRDLMLQDNEGICETCHIHFFPQNIVAAQFNFYGPRVDRLSSYFRKILRESYLPFQLEPLLHHDIVQKLRDKVAIRRMSISVRRSYLDVIAQADEALGGAMRAAWEGTNADCVGIILEPEPYQRTNLSDRVIGIVRNLAGRPDLREEVRDFRVKAVDQDQRSIEELNLLEDKLIRKKMILRQNERSRVLDTDDAYRKIQEAYFELRQEILSAGSVSIGRQH